jgi:hypothetical protein
MIVALMLGFFDRSKDILDKHLKMKTKAGYYVYVILAAIVTFGVLAWFSHILR